MQGLMFALLLAPMLWGLVWIVAWVSNRLPAKSAWRPIFGLGYAIATLGLVALQAHLLTVFGPAGFDLLYVVVPEFVAGIVLLFYRGVKEEKAKKEREAAFANSVTISKLTANFPSSNCSRDGNDTINIAQDPNGVLSVVIPPRMNQASFMLAAILIAGGFAGILSLQFRLMHAVQRQMQLLEMTEIIRVLQAADLLAVSYLIAAIFTGKRTLTLSQATLQIRYSLLGLPVSRKSFENTGIKNIRYERWEMPSGKKTIERRGIRFEAGSKTYSFGNSIPEPQAHELIERMRQVYVFPAA